MADKNFRLEFEVVRGGLLDCKLKITDPHGQTVIDKIAYFNKEVRTGEGKTRTERQAAVATVSGNQHGAAGEWRQRSYVSFSLFVLCPLVPLSSRVPLFRTTP